MTAEHVLADYCRAGHACPNGQLLWEQLDVAHSAWVEAGWPEDPEDPDYRWFRHRQRIYDDHRRGCYRDVCGSCEYPWAIWASKCARCGKRRRR